MPRKTRKRFTPQEKAAILRLHQLDVETRLALLQIGGLKLARDFSHRFEAANSPHSRSAAQGHHRSQKMS